MTRPGLAARVAALLGAAIVAATCADVPDSPKRQNPFDPGNAETGGDPFHLTADTEDGNVVLTWDEVLIAGSAGYTVYRSRTADSLASAPAILESGIRATSYVDTMPIHDATSYYVVTVRNSEGDESLRSEVAGVRLDLPPLLLVRVPDCAECATTERRAVDVLLLAEDVDSLYLANARDSIGLLDPVGYLATGAPITWTLAASASNSDIVKTVFARLVRPDGSSDEIISDSIEVTPITLHMTVDGNPAGPVTTGHRSVLLAFQSASGDSQPPAGVESLEVSLDAAFAGNWAPFATSDSLALATASLDTVFARVKNEFGIEARDSVPVQGDSLRNATIVLNNARTATDPSATGLCRVNVHVRSGHATSICLSNTPIPPCTLFEELSGFRAGWPLPGTGEVRVYAILANEWRPEGAGVLFDEITVRNDTTVTAWITAPPAPGTTYVIGKDSTFVGIARSRTCGPAIVSCNLFVDSAPLGAATLESAAPSDSFDVMWRLTWTVAGPERESTVLAIVKDAEGDSIAVSESILIVPGGSPSRQERR